MKASVVLALASSLIRNAGLKFACVHLTTRCNAKCVDRCNIWTLKPMDMPLNDAKFVIDVLAKEGFTVAYFTGGETGLYPYLPEVVEYGKKKGLITSITTNGTITESTLKELSGTLDVLSVSVDHYDLQAWEKAKQVVGIPKIAKRTISLARALGIKVYAITFLNPYWTPSDVEKIIAYVNKELGVSFTLSYPYISSSYGTFVVGGNLQHIANAYDNLIGMSRKILEMKNKGYKIANASCYLRDVLRAHKGLPMRYPCKAGKTILAIDCNLNVFPCYKKQKMFNLKNHPSLKVPAINNSKCDNRDCLINGYKEPSLASKETLLRAVLEELLSNPVFYFKLLS